MRSVLLGGYAASGGLSLPKFLDNLSAQTGYPETSERITTINCVISQKSTDLKVTVVLIGK
jgi:hypothetical protein